MKEPGARLVNARTSTPNLASAGDRVVIRDQEGQRWITCETVLALRGSTTVRVELLEIPLMATV
jgi:hypothetical protein